MKYKKGNILLFTKGMYSDSVNIMLSEVLTDFDPDELREEYIKSFKILNTNIWTDCTISLSKRIDHLKEWESGENFSPDKFLDWLINNKKVIKEIDYGEFWLGDGYTIFDRDDE